MTPRFILAVTDFSSQGDNALARAALLAAEHGAALKLVCIAYPDDTPPADAPTRLAHHALQLAQAHGISARAAGRLHQSLEELRPDVAASDLIVWGTAPANTLRSFFLGQPVEEFMRTAGRPVLVVRRGAKHPYRTLMVAVDFKETPNRLVDMSFSLSQTASVKLFHAFSAPYEGKLRNAGVSASVIKAYREQRRRDAQHQMIMLTDSIDTTRRVQWDIAHGEPARLMLVQQERSGTDLIVVGKHLGSTFSDLFLGSVAGRLLNSVDGMEGGADVLVVPYGWQPATNTSAASRLAAERRTSSRVRAGAPLPPVGPNPAAMRLGG